MSTHSFTTAADTAVVSDEDDPPVMIIDTRASSPIVGTHGLLMSRAGIGAQQAPPAAEPAPRDPAKQDTDAKQDQDQKREDDKDPSFEDEVTVVASTRTGRRVEDEPIRVEVVPQEEIDEKVFMTPGDVSMMLTETNGLRVQVTSPSLGAAGVRVQGLRGRYTQVLSDGLPLYGPAGTIGILQIPPMDLGQVEVIKGVASALYGGSALGGVVNLISRQPQRDRPEREVLVNRTSRGGTDGVVWLSSRGEGNWGYTFLGGGHFQSRNDIDADGWTDLPSYERATARPRVMWEDGSGRSVFFTVGGMAEGARRGHHARTRGARRPAVSRKPDDAPVRCRRRGAPADGIDQVPHPAQLGPGPVARSHVRADTRARLPSHLVRRRCDDRTERPAHVGRRRGPAARQVRGARSAGVRLQPRRARRLRTGRLPRHELAGGVGQRTRRLSQRIRQLLQSARLGAAPLVLGLDGEALHRHGFRRADAVHRGNRSRRAFAAATARRPRSRTWPKRVVRSRMEEPGARAERHALSIADRLRALPAGQRHRERARARFVRRARN